MSEKTLAEILAERRAVLDAEIEKASSGEPPAEEAAPTRKKKKPKKKPAAAPPPAEVAGQGRDFAAENARRLMEQLNARYEAAKRAGNVDLMNKVDAQRKALAESAGG